LGIDEKDPPPTKEGIEPSDVDLVKAYRKGDIHAFEELHRRYVASIYRLVRRKLGDALLAEDIACLLYTSPSPRDLSTSRMPSSA